MMLFVFFCGATLGACLSVLIIGATRLQDYDGESEYSFEEYEEDDEDEAVDW